jgi:phosphoribosyl 1,2-cyclic phosphodiesterase
LIESGRENDIYEVKRLQKIRLTPKKFIHSALESGYDIFHKDYYFLRPVYKMKFGLPAIKSNLLSYIPVIKNVFSLEASYILKNK